MQPFEGDPYTRGRLTSLRNKPQQKQPGQLSASIPGLIVSQRVQLLFDGEKYVLLLCAWRQAFLRSGHILWYFNRNHCMGISHCHFLYIVNISYAGVFLKVGLRKSFPTRNRLILSNIKVSHFNRLITLMIV